MKKLILLVIALWLLTLLIWNNKAIAAYWYESCYSTYGFGAQDNFNWTCSCIDWYSFAINIFWKKECISNDQQCKDQYWYWSKAKWDSCVCKDWYAFEQWYSGKKCQLQYCGLYSSFNDNTKKCECNDWYTQDTTYSSFTCRKKAISAYFLLSWLNENQNKGIFYTNWNWWKYYSIEYWYGCYNIADYYKQALVINLMYDQRLSYGDYIVLNKDNQTCKVTSYDDITDTYNWLSDAINTSYTNSSNSDCWKNSISTNGKCSCISWYTWEYPDDSKNFDCKPKAVILTPDQSCQVSFWIYAISVGDDLCNCKSGYKWTVDKKSCELEKVYTTPVKTTKKLTCKKWELIRNGKCVNPKTLK